MRLLTASRLVTDGRLLSPGWLLFDARVAEVGEGEPPARVRELASSEVTEVRDGVVTPGLVDIQVNGAFGVDFAAATEREWVDVARQLPSTGVTAFVPTLITAPVGELVAGVTAYGARRASLAADAGAARTLGIHVEGPFLAESRRGAHRAELLTDPAPPLVDALVEVAASGLAYLTLAPERAGAIEAVRRLRAAGVRVALGHTDATHQTVRMAADAGATMVTHLFNAQRPMRHRDPGTVGAALTDPRLTCGLIADLHHVAPLVVQLAFQAAGGRIALVTDAVAAMGMPDGTYELGGERLEVHPGKPPVRDDGTIAGSALRMDEAVAHVVHDCSVDLVTAVDAATRVPADAVGRHELGRLATGSPADLVWLDDDLRTRATWLGGRMVWSRDAHRQLRGRAQPETQP